MVRRAAVTVRMTGHRFAIRRHSAQVHRVHSISIWFIQFYIFLELMGGDTLAVQPADLQGQRKWEPWRRQRQISTRAWARSSCTMRSMWRTLHCFGARPLFCRRMCSMRGRTRPAVSRQRQLRLRAHSGFSETSFRNIVRKNPVRRHRFAGPAVRVPALRGPDADLRSRWDLAGHPLVSMTSDAANLVEISIDPSI